MSKSWVYALTAAQAVTDKSSASLYARWKLTENYYYLASTRIREYARRPT